MILPMIPYTIDGCMNPESVIMASKMPSLKTKQMHLLPPAPPATRVQGLQPCSSIPGFQFPLLLPPLYETKRSGTTKATSKVLTNEDRLLQLEELKKRKEEDRRQKEERMQKRKNKALPLTKDHHRRIKKQSTGTF